MRPSRCVLMGINLFLNVHGATSAVTMYALTTNHGIAQGGPYLETYDEVSDTWDTADTSVAIWQRSCSLAFNGYWYFPGASYRLDPIANIWTVLNASSTSARSNAACAELSGKMYLAGGGMTHLSAVPILSSVEVYDPSTNLWSSIEELVLS